jgi:hypothetical protein
MRTKLGLLASMVLAAAVSAQAPGGPVDLSRLSWMEGRWAGTSDGVVMEETWLAPSGGALLGVHRDVRGGRMVSFEFLRIETTEEGTFYFASPRSAPPTPFRLVEMGERRVAFENKQHDFPQRILYWLDAAGALHARIEGPHGGTTVGEEWTWTKTR